MNNSKFRSIHTVSDLVRIKEKKFFQRKETTEFEKKVRLTL